MLWLEYHEKIVRFFAHTELSSKTINDVPDATRELANKMRDAKLSIHSTFFDIIADMLEGFTVLWNRKNGFKQDMFPVAKASSVGPKEGAKHKCAAFTIMHNEVGDIGVYN